MLILGEGEAWSRGDWYGALLARRTMRCPSLEWSAAPLVDGAGGRRKLRLEGEVAEGLFVLGEVVAEDVPEGLGLLGAEIDALEVIELDLFGCALAHGSEDEEEVPDAHADLDAVGIAVAIVGGGGELDFGLSRTGFGLGGLAHVIQLHFPMGWRVDATGWMRGPIACPACSSNVGDGATGWEEASICFVRQHNSD